MIEQAMVFALGFMIAGLVALAIAPAFWHRAIRLSTRRLEMQLPLSAEEIRADRDLLRAEFAVEARRLEQKAEALNLAHAADRAELGRDATRLVERDAHAAALNARLAGQAADIAALHSRLADVTGELAATATALDGETILVERKDAELFRLRDDLSGEREAAAARGAALERVKFLLAREEGNVSAQTDLIARLEHEASTLRTERAALAEALKAAEAKAADYEAALALAAKRESDLQRKRERQIETTRAVERRLLDRMGRLRDSESSARIDLERSRAACEGLKQDLAKLRQTMSEQASAPDNAKAAAALSAVEIEDNAILRQTVNEIGAAIIRMAASGLTPPHPTAAPAKAEREEPAAKPASRSLAKAEAPPTRAGAV